jgi:hypothetical protein
LNQFIAYKTDSLKPVKSDLVIKNMILSPYSKVVVSKSLGTIGSLSEENSNSVHGLKLFESSNPND